MKKRLAVFALALLLTAGLAAAGQPGALTPPSAAAPERSPENLLADIFSAPRPVNRSASCEEQVYQECLVYCWDLSQTGGCDFFANQTCLCWRGPADCPLCY
jgi:hypothetical protein